MTDAIVMTGARGAEASVTTEVVDRLRASLRDHKKERFEDGRTIGRRWAAEDAETLELMCLAKERSRLGGNWDVVFEAAGNGPYSIGEQFVFWIRPECAEDCDAAHAFWNSMLCEHCVEEATSDAAFVRGFAEGALEVWQEVQARL
jgi:hypothetical protein